MPVGYDIIKLIGDRCITRSTTCDLLFSDYIKGVRLK